MKTSFKLLVLGTIMVNLCYGQPAFKKEWKSGFSFSPSFRMYTHDLSLILGGDMKMLEMVDGNTGKSLWTFDVKKKLGVKSLENWVLTNDNEGSPVKITYKKSKDDDIITSYLNSSTGELMNSTKAAKTIKPKLTNILSRALYGESFFEEETNTQLDISFEYKSKFLNALGGGGSAVGSGTALNITVSATGGNNWTAVIETKAIRHLCYELLPSGEPEMMMKVMAKDGKVFVITESITVLDLATGKTLWTTSFDNVTCTMGLSATQEIGRSAFPIINNGSAYVCDFSKDSKSIKKLDLNSGNPIWSTEKLSSNDIVNSMEVDGNTLIVKFGGVVRKEKYKPLPNGGSISTAKYDYEGNSDICGYDIKTGKLLWNSDTFAKDEKFSKSTCNMLIENGKIYACSPNNLLIINTMDGKLIGKSEYGKKDIAQATYVLSDGVNIYVEGSEGVASLTMEGKKNFSVSTGKNFYSAVHGNAYYIWTGKSETELNQFVRVDLNNGEILGKIKNCYSPYFASSGDYFLQFDKKSITKYKTSK